jgi:hypothetical protein
MAEIKAKKVLFKNRDGESLIPYVGDTAIDHRITNCITEIPQRIKLELADGVLTLKAGSKVIVPNGAGVFEYIPIANDLNMSASGTDSNNNVIVYYYNNSLRYTTVGRSGATEDTSNGLFYNTTENKVRRYATGLAHDGTSLPIAILTMTNGVLTSINQVFNGFGYIGSTVWVDKGVKGLAPNGRNEDGTLNNKLVEFTGIYTRTFTTSSSIPIWFALSASGVGDFSKSNYIYNEKENKIQKLSTGEFQTPLILAGIYNRGENGVISNFQPKLPFRAVDYNEVKDYIKSERYDGQWIYKTLELTTATTVGTYTIDLSSYLPNDSYNYEVIVSAAAYSSGNSGSLTSFRSDLVNSNMYLTYTNTNARHDANTIIIPVAKTKRIYYVIAKANVEHHGAPTALAYRRIGTNL